MFFWNFDMKSCCRKKYWFLRVYEKLRMNFCKFDILFLGFEVAESVDFTMVLRYRVRYWFFVWKWVKCLILLGFGRFWIGCFKNEVGVEMKQLIGCPENRTLVRVFATPPLEKVGFFPFYRDSNVCFDFETGLLEHRNNRTFVW